MKYKSFILLLATVMVLSLSACGKIPTSDKSASSVSVGTQVEPSNEGDALADENPTANADISANDEAWKRSLRKVCWKTMVSRRTIMRIWVTAFIRSM